MGTKEYNKLVRDRIPEILQSKGLAAKIALANPADVEVLLLSKMQEELKEYVGADTSEHRLEELADILEIIHALSRRIGSDPKTLETIRAEKTEERGSFDEGYILESISE